MIKIDNLHTRLITCSPAKAGYLIDSLAEFDSPFWPTRLWPRGQWEQPLRPGSTGSHGGIQYVVETYHPGKSVCFRFTHPPSYQGIHIFSVDVLGDHLVCFKHRTRLSISGVDAFLWQAAIRWVHDALIQDALDCAELYLTQRIQQPNRWLKRVYVLRYLLGISRLVYGKVSTTWKQICKGG